MEHIQKMKVIWDHLLNSSDGGREIDDPQLLLSMLIGKTITDIIMYGNIPAKDKLLEVEMVFAENWSLEQPLKNLCWIWQTMVKHGSWSAR